MASKSFWIRSAFAAGLSVLALPSAAFQVSSTAGVLQLLTMEGEGASFDLRRPTPIDLVVQVRDPQGNPRRQAIVVFTLPGFGASAFFVGGSRTLMVTTDDNGIARARVFRPNVTAGDFTVMVTAQLDALRGASEIHLHNINAPGGGFHAGKWVAIGSIAAGVAIGVVVGVGVLQPDPNRPLPPTTVAISPPAVKP